MLSLETGLNEPSFPFHCSLNKVSGFQAHIHIFSLTGSVLISDPHLTSAMGSDMENESKSWCSVLAQCSNSEHQLSSLIIFEHLSLAYQPSFHRKARLLYTILSSSRQNLSIPLTQTLLSIDFWLLSLQFPAVLQYVFINWWNKTCVGNLTFSKHIWRISFSNEVQILVYNLKYVKYF